MQEIEKEFADRSYRYAQVERHGDIAIYEQQHKESPTVRRFEVVRIRIRPAHTWPNGTTTPEHEAYPSAGSWGRDGFTKTPKKPLASAMGRMVQSSNALRHSCERPSLGVFSALLASLLYDRASSRCHVYRGRAAVNQPIVGPNDGGPRNPPEGTNKPLALAMGYLTCFTRQEAQACAQALIKGESHATDHGGSS
jgi:hypothetical protein